MGNVDLTPPELRDWTRPTPVACRVRGPTSKQPESGKWSAKLPPPRDCNRDESRRKPLPETVGRRGE